MDYFLTKDLQFLEQVSDDGWYCYYLNDKIFI